MSTITQNTWRLALALILFVGLILRLHGIHNPLLDHPGWRQGDTGAIARNFATLDYNPLHPQTDYNGPPPNYVELELQIVPFFAATLYRIFGIHEIFGRLISVAFSLGTIVTLAYFGRALFASALAGLSAATLFALYPGSVYYGRTFMPDTTMTFFLTTALFATFVWLHNEARHRETYFWLRAALLTAIAFLAKPVALLAIIPIKTMMLIRDGGVRAALRPYNWGFFVVALLPLILYDRIVSSIAEWHWASGITRLHVIPGFIGAFSSFDAFLTKARLWKAAITMLPHTMLGGIATCLFICAILTPLSRRVYPLLGGWLIAALIYAYVVVTVERVDYYLYPFLPLAALWTGGAIHVLYTRYAHIAHARLVGSVAGLGLCSALLLQSHAITKPYYHYKKAVYLAARALDTKLPAQTLIVMGHYDPSILYYINRKGWEEDPYLWTPFDEQSAIRKGALYFIAIEKPRLARNVELAAWLERFPIVSASTALWTVYKTDPHKQLPGAEARWKAFRTHERDGITR